LSEQSNWQSRLAGRGLSDRQLAQLECVLHVLHDDERAPTTVRTAHEAVDAHLADSLVGLDFIEIREACAIADLGSGAGFPGTALAVALPRARVWLVESQRRKCAFLRALCAQAEIANAAVVCERAEEWAEGREANDAAVARALAPQPVVLEYAAPLLRMGGALLDWRGRRSGEDERAAQRAAQTLGMQLREIRHVRPFGAARDRHVHVFVKTGQTPARFPRRAGIARKRPLGS
jgi:16S rRNA (guanine527-N7)-methyltransferase